MLLSSCESNSPVPDPGDSEIDTVHFTDFPAFITPVDEYFDLSISSTPLIDSGTYILDILGTQLDSAYFSLEDLRKLNMIEKALTVECIENPPNGDLLATANWKGFRLYDLLDSLGIKEGSTIVKYCCADGYYTYNTLEELQSYDVIGALYMNGDPIPSRFGFPLRILFPGYYGVRQPGWVVKIELLDSGPEDFWAERGWDTDSAMHIDSKIFFPKSGEKFALGDTIKVGGAAFGPRRISTIEVSMDGGKSWKAAEIIRETDQDFVWVFWETTIVPVSAGVRYIHARATAFDGSVQPLSDLSYWDGSNASPLVEVSVLE